jgi:hypothetical protein
MNNLLFLNHLQLFCYDNTLKHTPLYPKYSSIYQFFPDPPGIENFLSRNKNIDLGGPWSFESTAFPIPNLLSNPISFTDAADSFGQEVAQEIDTGKDVYLMWSGGIDSTCIAVSILKNLQQHQKSKLFIVLSDLSRHENPMFYHRFLKDFNQIELSNFDPAVLDLRSSIILDGEGGDQVFGSSAANKLFSLYPEKILLPWRTEIDFLRAQWHSDRVPAFWDIFIDIMTDTINQGTAPVDTLHDFYWWLNFNFKLDSVMFRHSLRLGENVADQDFEYFCSTTMRRMFASTKMQQWSMQAGATAKIGLARKTVKWEGRKYIYDFDQNEYYFREKRKEFSTSTISTIASKYFAVDKNYKRYTIADRAVRQEIRTKFYPDHTGRIEFFTEKEKIYAKVDA